MTLPPRFFRLSLAAALIAPGVFSGCSNEANTPEAQVAEQATGIKPDATPSKTVKVVRDVIVTDEKKVQDANTGEILSDTVKKTPVKITEQKSEKTDVKVDVGDTKTSTAVKK